MVEIKTQRGFFLRSRASSLILIRPRGCVVLLATDANKPDVLGVLWKTEDPGRGRKRSGFRLIHRIYSGPVDGSGP
ncbi:hypothetical protein AOLI_G00190370 [Acnodon oligacanthus]